MLEEIPMALHPAPGGFQSAKSAFHFEFDETM